MQQPLYGLIGGKLGHSYSKIIHEKIADYTYELLPLPTEAEARTFMEKRAFAAINVTIPYKQFVIPYCDVVDPKAQAIGAVNTIVNRDGKLYGYNTDYAGFAYLAGAHGVDFAGKTVLILGTGGTHSTVTAVCRDGGAKEILTASRTGKGDALLYSEAMHRPDVQIIVNTTPCGMFPNVGQCLIDPKAFPALEAVLDVVYNPFRTELLLRAEDCGVIAAGGFEMLVAQAVFATEHFTGRQLDTAAIIPAVSRELRHQLANVSIIGMPGCGKSTVGAALAKLRAMVAAQGGDPAVIDDPSGFPAAAYEHDVVCMQDGWLYATDTEKIGIAAVLLGAGRETKESVIDPAAGIRLLKKAGDPVKKGDVLARLYAGDAAKFAAAEEKFHSALTFAARRPQLPALVLARVDKDGVTRF